MDWRKSCRVAHDGLRRHGLRLLEFALPPVNDPPMLSRALQSIHGLARITLKLPCNLGHHASYVRVGDGQLSAYHR